MIAPTTESVAARRAKGERVAFDPDCPSCVREGQGAFMPPHDASRRCESGARTHCSCDTCF